MDWKTHIRHPFDRQTVETPRRIVVDVHPLKNTPIVVSERLPLRILSSQPSTGQSTPVQTPASIMEPLSAALEGLDPLSKFAIQESVDPLSKIALEMEAAKSGGGDDAAMKSKGQNSLSEKMEPWSARKNAILAKFTTSERLSIVTSFLAEGERVEIKAQSSVVDKVQHRLEQLDDFEEGSQRKIDLSQSEYVGKIKLLNKELVSAWYGEQRVKALKIAIQCAKLLADTDALRFYPSKFVLITDILDIFGQLVYDRLKSKSEYFRPGSKVPSPLPEDFSSEMISDSVKETCRNWFFKIASIRELVPRLYVEVAILKSYKFLSTCEFSDALLRVTQMIRGVGNPLVAVYMRCYVCRVGMNILSHHGTDGENFLVKNFLDFIDSYNHLFSRKVKQEILRQKMEASAYLSLYTPALDFILQAAALGTPENRLPDLLELCRERKNCSLIVNAMMSSFGADRVSERALLFLEIIDRCSAEKDGLPVHVLLRTLGLCVSIRPPPHEHRRQVLAAVWRHLSSVKEPGSYVNCAQVWMQYVVCYFGSNEINTILGDILRHLTLDRSFENHYSELRQIVETITFNIQDLELLLSMENFLPFIDLIRQDVLKMEVCKNVLKSCSRLRQHTSDPVIINGLMFLCSVLHDSVNALMVEDERRQIGEILGNAVRIVDYGRDFEQQLSFYVEVRGLFSNLDSVMAQLVHCANLLAVKTHRVVKGNHTKKTGDFVRACAAYCFITIPSISSIFTRLELYLLSGRVALFNNCLGQADTCFKTVLGIIPELTPHLREEKAGHFTAEQFLIGYVGAFLSTLLVSPDNPEWGVLTLTKALVNVLKNLEWSRNSAALIAMYLNVLDLLSTFAQEDYPYHVDKVQSNDALYGSDQKFIAELDKMCSLIVNEILIQLKRLGPCRRQSALALELLVRIIIRADVHQPSSQSLVANLWQLCLKNENHDAKYMARTREYLLGKSASLGGEWLDYLTKKLALQHI